MPSSLRRPFALCAVLLCSTAVAASAAAPVAAQQHDRSVVGRYADALGAENGRLPIAVRRDLAERLLLLSSYYKLDPCLLAALVSVESAWRSHAVSPVGALGYGQLMPGTAAGLDVNALEPYENLDGTARYLRRMLNRYSVRDTTTRMRLALASYNAGPYAVARYGGVPPYRETRTYVENVLRVRASFVAAVATRATYDIAALLARPAAVPSHRAAVRTPPARRPAQLPPAARYAPPPPAVRYETSHSFLARMLGIRHRVSAPAAIASKETASATPDVPAIVTP